jgi:hypothetical protein
MNVSILPSAINDLADGFDFYEKQEAGLGDYFLNSLLADVDSLKIYGGFTARFMDFIARAPNDFLSQFITNTNRNKFSFAPCSIAAATRNGFDKN